MNRREMMAGAAAAVVAGPAAAGPKMLEVRIDWVLAFEIERGDRPIRVFGESACRAIKDFFHSPVNGYKDLEESPGKRWKAGIWDRDSQEFVKVMMEGWTRRGVDRA